MFRQIYFAFVSGLARLLFAKRKIVWPEGEQAPQEPAIFVSNHSGILGPVVMLKYFNLKKKIWVTSGMTSKANSANYFFHDMMIGRASKNKKKTRKNAKLVVSLVQPLIKKNKRFIVVNKTSKDILKTFHASVDALCEGKNLVIFPEKHKRYGKFVNSFHQGFVDVARLYFKKTGKEILFYPVYVGNELKTINIGKPFKFDSSTDKKQVAHDLCEKLQESIEKLGASQKEHKVIPYVPETFYEFYREYEDDEIGFFNFVNQPYSE